MPFRHIHEIGSGRAIPIPLSVLFLLGFFTFQCGKAIKKDIIQYISRDIHIAETYDPESDPTYLQRRGINWEIANAYDNRLSKVDIANLCRAGVSSEYTNSRLDSMIVREIIKTKTMEDFRIARQKYKKWINKEE